MTFQASAPLPQGPKRVFMLGATGTIGRATLAALLDRGHDVVCFVRAGSAARADLPHGATLRTGDVTDQAALLRDGFAGERFDVLVSCLASRTGAPDSALAVDYTAHVNALAAAQQAGVGHMVLLSAICVQKPLLAFQQAKLAFEQHLTRSGMVYSIVRPTAFYKSLSGQVTRLKKGKPFLVFGTGELTACKPISDADLASFLADCLDQPALQNRILPIGGREAAMTPLQQGAALFAALGLEPKFRHVPVRLLDTIIATLDLVGRLSPRAKAKAELARIGRYYATESMLWLNPETGRYDAQATPETGKDSLAQHYAKLARGDVADDRGDHAVF